MNFYDSYLDGAEELPYQQRIEFYGAVIGYVRYDREPAKPLSGAALGMFTMIKPSLDKQKARSSAGKASANSKTKSKKTQRRIMVESSTDAQQTLQQTAQQNDFETLNYQDININSSYRVTREGEILEEGDSLAGSSSKVDSLVGRAFIPPTVEEVRNFCAANLLDKVNAELFVSTYEAQGWRLGNGIPMTNWQAAVQKWNSQDRNSKAVSRAQGRDADFTEFSDSNWERG